jgi:hypothetical protein
MGKPKRVKAKSNFLAASVSGWTDTDDMAD